MQRCLGVQECLASAPLHLSTRTITLEERSERSVEEDPPQLSRVMAPPERLGASTR